MSALTFSVTSSDCTTITIGFSITKTSSDSISLMNFEFQNLSTEIDYTAIQTCFNSAITYSSNTTTLVAGSIILDISCFLLDSISAGLTEIPDGVYNIIMNATNTNTGVDTILTYNVSYLSTCTLCCKVKTLAAKVNLDTTCCDPKTNIDLYNFIEANGLLSCLDYSAICGSLTEIDTNLKNIQKFLLNINCNCC